MAVDMLGRGAGYLKLTFGGSPLMYVLIILKCGEISISHRFL